MNACAEQSFMLEKGIALIAFAQMNAQINTER